MLREKCEVAAAKEADDRRSFGGNELRGRKIPNQADVTV